MSAAPDSRAKAARAASQALPLHPSASPEKQSALRSIRSRFSAFSTESHQLRLLEALRLFPEGVTPNEARDFLRLSNPAMTFKLLREGDGGEQLHSIPVRWFDPEEDCDRETVVYALSCREA